MKFQFSACLFILAAACRQSWSGWPYTTASCTCLVAPTVTLVLVACAGPVRCEGQHVCAGRRAPAARPRRRRRARPVHRPPRLPDDSPLQRWWRPRVRSRHRQQSGPCDSDGVGRGRQRGARARAGRGRRRQGRSLALPLPRRGHPAGQRGTGPHGGTCSHQGCAGAVGMTVVGWFVDATAAAAHALLAHCLPVHSVLPYLL